GPVRAGGAGGAGGAVRAIRAINAVRAVDTVRAVGPVRAVGAVRTLRSDGSGLAPELVRLGGLAPGRARIDRDPGDLGRLVAAGLDDVAVGRRGGAHSPGQAQGKRPGDEEGRRLSEPGDRSRE